MKIYKKIGLGILIIFGLLFILAVWYKYAFSMEEATPMTINSSMLEQKILIATQGSEFKDKVTATITAHYKKQPIFIKVIDIKELPNINSTNYNAIIVIHTWENWKPPLEVEKFIEQSQSFKNKIVMLSTSGNGNYKMQDVDAISGASNLKKADEFSQKIIAKVDVILATTAKY